MASYEELSPTKKGIPGIKITVEKGYDEETGERLRFFKTVRMKTLSDRAIKKAITEFEIEVDKNVNVVKLENITFGEFTKRWMDVYVRVDLAIKTRNTYQSYLNTGVNDFFGKIKMRKVKPYHVDVFFKEQKESHQKSQNGKFTMLQSIFAKAEKWGIIEVSPMLKVDRPTVQTKGREMQFYEESQIEKLLTVLNDVYPKHRVQIKLAVLVGLRMTEIAGIRLEDINYNTNTILIEHTLQYDKEIKKFFLGPTKTKRTRIVHVPAKFMLEIKEYAKNQKKLKILSGTAWNPLLNAKGEPINLLFTKTNGFPTHPDSLTATWKEIVSKHGLPALNLHGLRHTYASFAVSKGVNFKVIQEQLGHADIKLTLNTYSHLTERDKEKASNVFNDIL